MIRLFVTATFTLISLALFCTAGCGEKRPTEHDDVVDILEGDGSGEVEFPFDIGSETEDSTVDQVEADEQPYRDVVEPHPQAACTMRFFAAEDGVATGPPWSCAIPVTSTTGCDELARCVCQALEELERAEAPLDIDQCVGSMTIPRGMITLADYCALSGTTSEVPSLSELVPTVDDVDGMQWMNPMSDITIEMDDGCDEVAAFTVWAEPHEWHLSLGQEGEPFPVGGWSLDEFPIEAPPLLTIDTIAGLEHATATLHLTQAGQDQVRARFAEPSSLAGRPFVIHTAEHELEEGIVMSTVVSSTRDRTVFLIEDVVSSDYGEIRFYQSYPAEDPAPLYGLTTGLLAAEGKLFDAACISTCGCPQGRSCREGICQPLTGGGCQGDDDCCLGTCGDDGRCL